MKTIIPITLIMLLALELSAFAQGLKTETFRVEGNCSMCKTRIEKAANSVESVQYANWDIKTKMITVKFDPDKTDLHKIHMTIAKAGHDTEMHKASDEAYDKLPACCKYDRRKEEGGQY